ncbi:MAG: T9SS type A sorting domain-containing protein [Sphingobacteriales bacterium]|nr:MAG: T9SS type A sorting domain-containing protein [Sphingobacteriales bacterium]
MTKQITLALLALTITGAASAQRFLTEVFPNVTVTPNVTYGQNISVFPPPTPAMIDLKMDVYEPAGTDTMAMRPLVVFMHTGSYLPTYINQSPTGSRNDSATVEMCKQFAKRGYVVANIDYRLGWNPAGSSVDIRRGTLLNAVYRSVQDAKAAVRFFRKDAATTNTYKIDSNKVILGGQGTGGYIAVNYAVLDDPAQITLPKFISSTTEPSYGFVAGQPYVNQAVLGDYDGYGGMAIMNNPNNSVGYGNKVQFVFNLGGAMGDSSWLKAGAAPMVAFHMVGDPFAPYGNGIVYVPGTTPQSVVDVSGSGTIIPRAVALGNNACFATNNFTDPYTMRANAINGGAEGLFPFYSNPAMQAGPWEWYDSTATVAAATAFGQDGTLIYNNAALTNPDMSKAKGLAYIDTIMNYLNPRVVQCLNLVPTAGIKDITALDNSIEISPNPVAETINVRTSLSGNRIISVTITDMSGRVVSHTAGIHASQVSINRNGLVAGLYFMSVNTTTGKMTKKLMMQ